jgi:hypothetical protein
MTRGATKKLRTYKCVSGSDGAAELLTQTSTLGTLEKCWLRLGKEVDARRPTCIASGHSKTWVGQLAW